MLENKDSWKVYTSFQDVYSPKCVVVTGKKSLLLRQISNLPKSTSN